ncbi:MAG: hypothetical protein KIT20_06705 [Alphaproteobacteria bacterium]|nr:hypothetical protein [Alphaproteobacteria bacterium]
MGARPLDAHGGMVEFLHEDPATGRFAIESRAEVGAVLERNRALRGANDGYSPSRELRRVASIPPIVQLLWIERYGADPLAPGNEALLRRLLNSSEWSHLRTSEGRF